MHAKQFHFAGIGSRQAFADFDSGCFARAVGTEKAEAFAGVDLQVEAIDGDNVLVSLAETCDAKGRLGDEGGHETSIASGRETCNPIENLRVHPQKTRAGHPRGRLNFSYVLYV